MLQILLLLYKLFNWLIDLPQHITWLSRDHNLPLPCQPCSRLLLRPQRMYNLPDVKKLVGCRLRPAPELSAGRRLSVTDSRKGCYFKKEPFQWTDHFVLWGMGWKNDFCANVFFSFGKSPWKRFLFFHNVGMRLYLFTWFDSANIFLTISSPPPTHPLPPSPPPPTHSSPTFSPQLIYSPHSSPPLLLLIYSLSERIHVIKWLIFKDLRMLNGKQVSQNHRKWSLPRSCDQHNFSIESKICA